MNILGEEAVWSWWNVSPEEVWCPLLKKYGNDIQEWGKYPVC